MSENKKGLFITFEGVDGSGKTSQIELLKKYLSDKEIDFITTCEPQKGGRVRELLVAGKGTFTPVEEANMMFEDREDHVKNKVLPAMDEGKLVISDRFADSSRVFQGYGMGVDLDYIEGLYKKHVGNFEPDLTVILDIDPEKGLNRSLKRNSVANTGEDKYEKMGVSLQEKVRNGYLAIAKRDSKRCVVIDASGSIEEVHNKIIAVIEDTLSQNFKKNIKRDIASPRF